MGLWTRKKKKKGRCGPVSECFLSHDGYQYPCACATGQRKTFPAGPHLLIIGGAGEEEELKEEAWPHSPDAQEGSLVPWCPPPGSEEVRTGSVKEALPKPDYAWHTDTFEPGVCYRQVCLQHALCTQHQMAGLSVLFSALSWHLLGLGTPRQERDIWVR